MSKTKEGEDEEGSGLPSASVTAKSKKKGGGNLPMSKETKGGRSKKQGRQPADNSSREESHPTPKKKKRVTPRQVVHDERC